MKTGFVVKISILVGVGVAVFFLTRLALDHRSPGGEVMVEVLGNVERPGRYRCPKGTTKFSILERAGIRNNSDLRLVQVAETVENNQSLSVGVGKAVGIKEQVTLGWARVNFFLGSFFLFDSLGKKTPVEVNKLVPLQSALQTEADGRGEILLSDASTFTLWPNSRCQINKVLTVNAEGIKETEVAMLAGQGEFLIRPQGTNRLYILTPQCKVLVKGTELSVLISRDQTTVKVINGFVEVQRLKDSTRINLVGGQFTTIGVDTLAPLEVKYLSAEPQQEKDQREIFRREKQNYLEKNASYKMLYVANPAIFIVLNLDPSAKVISLNRIPGDLNISNIVEGFEKLDQAYLFGGPQFTVSICERLTSVKLNFYLIQTVEDVKLTLGRMGNLPVDVDVAAAKLLGIGSGVQTLTPDQAFQFMGPRISGLKDASERQNKVMEAIFKVVKEKKMRLSPLFAESILQGTKTDLSAKKIMDMYKTFSLSEDWAFKITSQL